MISPLEVEIGPIKPETPTVDLRGWFFRCKCEPGKFKNCKRFYAKNRFDRIRWHIDHNYNYTEICWGKRGRGKSNCEYKTARLFQPDFNEDRQVIYDLSQFFYVSRHVTKPGHVLMMDEGAIDAGNRASATMFGQLFLKRMQTMRYKQMIDLWCLPNLQLLDLNIRRMSSGVLWLWDDNRGTGEYEEPIEARNGDIYIRPYPKPVDWDYRFPMWPIGFPWPEGQHEIPGGQRPPVANFHFTPVPDSDPGWIKYEKLKRDNDKLLEDTLEDKMENLETLSKAAIRGSAYKKREHDEESATADFSEAISRHLKDQEMEKDA